MKPGQQARLGQVYIFFIGPAQFLLGSIDVLRCTIRTFLYNRKLPYRFIDRLVLFIGDRFHTDLAEALQKFGVINIDNERSMAGGLVHDIWRRRVVDVINTAHIQRNHQYFKCLEFHEYCRRNKPVNHHRAPAKPGKAGIHFVNGGDVLQRYSRSCQPLQINRVGGVLQVSTEMLQQKAPNSLVTWCIPFIVLHTYKGLQVRGQARYCLCLIHTATCSFTPQSEYTT